MKKHIFVATDGSDNAINAVEMAAELAAKFNVPLTIGHVYRFGRPTKELARMADVEHLSAHVCRETKTEFQIMTGVEGELFAGKRPASDVVQVITLIGDEIVNRAVQRAKELGVKDVHSATAKGDPADAILDMAQAAGADMIVLGHRGLGRLKTLILGSVAQKVLQQADCTVMSVR